MTADYIIYCESCPAVAELLMKETLMGECFFACRKCAEGFTDSRVLDELKQTEAMA